MALSTDSLTIPPASSLNGAGRGAEARQLAVAGNRSVVPLVYGEDRIGALVLNVLTSGGTLLVQCLWGFASDSINDVRLNDQAVPAGATISHYTGGQTAPDAALVAAFAAQGITYSTTLAGYAYSVLSMPARAFDGALNITARVRGRRLYDPRLDSTNGGAGVQRLGNPATWAWSANAALALADFLGNTLYGCSQAVDWASVASAAAACDAPIGPPGQTEPARTLGVAFVEAAALGDLAEALRAYAGCFLLPGSNGAVRLLPDRDDAPVAAYSHALGNIAAIDPLALRNMGAVPTLVEVIYTDTRLIPWRDAVASASLPGAGTTRPLRLSQVRLPGVQRAGQALREARERLNKLALNDLATAIEVFDEGIRHEVGDIITLTHPVGLNAVPMRVSAVSMPGAGRWRLALVRHSAAAYDAGVFDPGSAVAPSGLMPPGPPAAVAGLAGTVAQGIITWSWGAAPERDWAETRLRLGGTDWASAAPLWAGRATGYLQRVTAPGTYTLRVRHALQDGQESTATASASVNVLAADLVQSEPGAPGLSQVVVELYQWGSASAPADPSGTTVYTWATGGHASYTGGNGWAVAVPANPGTAGARLWVARKALSAPVGTATSSVSWTGGFTVLAATVNGNQGPTGSQGNPGSPGIKAATPTVWRWAASVPTISGSGTYTWAAADTGLVPSGWSSAPGTGSPGQTLYGATVQLVDAAGAATTAIDWSTASISARGYAGTNGTSGPQGAAGASARRAYVLTGAAALGSGTVVTTGPASLPPDGSFGANGWQAQPGTPATGQALYQSDGLYDPVSNQLTWATPYISALKVGNLAALAVNTGSLTVDGVLTVSGSGWARSSNYSAGSAGWALGPTGAEFSAASIRGLLQASQINVPGGWLNSNITVSGGQIQGIGAGNGTQVDNQAIVVNRNLVRGFALWSSAGAGVGFYNTEARSPDKWAGFIQATAVQQALVSPSMSLPSGAGVTYTASFYAFVTSGGGTLHVDLIPDTLPEQTVALTSTPTLFKVLLEVGANAAANSCQMRFFTTSAPGGDVFIYAPKLEFGPSYTPWVANGDDALSTANPLTDANKQQLGYVGDLNATRGAPAGTIVGSIPAEQVESQSGAQARANNASAEARRTRPNLLVNGGLERGSAGMGGAIASFSIFDGVWGRVAISETISSGTGSVEWPPIPVNAGETYTVHGDTVLFAAGGHVYFDFIFRNAGGAVILDGPQNPRPAGHDFSANDAGRASLAVSAVAPAGAVSAQVRFIWEGLAGCTAIGFRLVKAERGALPHSAYSAEASEAALNNAVLDPTTGLAQTMRQNARSVLAAGAGITAGNLTWDTSGNRTGGSGVAMNNAGIVAFNPAGAATFLARAADGYVEARGLSVRSPSGAVLLAANVDTKPWVEFVQGAGSGISLVEATNSSTNTARLRSLQAGPGIAVSAAGGTLTVSSPTPAVAVHLTAEQTLMNNAGTVAVAGMLVPLESDSFYLVTGLLRVQTSRLTNGMRVGLETPAGTATTGAVLTLSARTTTAANTGQLAAASTNVGGPVSVLFTQSFPAAGWTTVPFEATVQTRTLAGTLQVVAGIGEAGQSAIVGAGSVLRVERLVAPAVQGGALVAPPAGIAAGYVSNDFRSDGNWAFSACLFTIRANGTWGFANSGTTGSASVSGNWLAIGSAAGWDVQFDNTSSQFDAGDFSNPAASFVQVSTDCTLSFSMVAAVAEYLSGSRTVVIRLRNRSTGEVTTLQTVTFTCTASSDFFGGITP